MTAFSLVPTPSPSPDALRGTVPGAQPGASASATPRRAAASEPAPRTDASVRVLLIEDVAQVASHISDQLRGHAHIKLSGTVTDGREALTRIHETLPDVVLVDALLQGPVSGLQVARGMRSAGLSTPIIFMTVPDRPVTLTPETGHAAALTIPLDRAGLLREIERLDEAHRGPAPVTPSGVFVVFSAKGGVGRTLIAHNLAAAMQRQGARVALVDGDIVHGDLRLLLDAPADAPSLLQFPTGHVTPEDVSAVLWQDPSGIDVLLAPPRMEQADLIVKKDMENALAMLRRCYDAVVVDAPARMDDMTLSMLDRADVVVDVVTAEAGSLRKTQRCRHVLAAAHFDMDKVVTVVNRADSRGDGASRAAAALGFMPEVVLPDEPALASGALAGRPVLAHPTTQALFAGFAALADTAVARERRASLRADRVA